MSRNKTDDHDLEIMAAWLYYIHGIGQEQVARRLDVSRTKVVRMLSHARETGLVKVTLEHQMAETLALGDWIARRFGIAQCILTPPVEGLRDEGDAMDLYRKAGVGHAAANLLTRRILNTRDIRVGVCGGTTVSCVLEAMRALAKADSTVVQLIGASRIDDGTSAYSLTLAMARIVGGTATTLAAPFVLSSAATARALGADRVIAEALEMTAQTDVNLLSVGRCDRSGSFFAVSGLRESEIASALGAGAVCEIAGFFLTASGALADTELNERRIGIGFADLQAADNVVVASGADKAEPLRAVLAAGIATSLVIDHSIAEHLVKTS